MDARSNGESASGRSPRVAVQRAQQLKSAVRERLAAHDIAAGTPNTEISFLLGFSDPNFFNRAFHRAIEPTETAPY